LQRALQKARLMLSAVEIKEIIGKDGLPRKLVRGVNAGQVAALLLREYSRLSIAAGRDVVLLDDFKMGITDDAVHSGRKIAGRFEVGDQVYETPQDVEVAVDQAPPKLAPLEDKAPDLGVHLDFDGLGDLYGSRQ
jgi:hypothetical protein